MIVKFHNKSERIKGLSFHPKRPWLLTGLHNGNIQLWDFRLGQVIDNFLGHESPVRSVQFHPSLSLFVSCSDDLTVRVWNYKSKKQLFVLRGHLDFVRCVNFHPELPWVISGSDDQTARLWNYQSRQMIAILTGHSHYVMQCQFHPTQDLLITCSLDQTIRLWSIQTLKKKFTQSRSMETTNELELVQILEGHNQGVNWCAFHPTQSLIVSASDDKKIKIWKYNDTRCWEIDTLSGHNGNVSCVAFHPKAEVIISNSEDKTQRVWDLRKKQEVDSFTNKELDRFWVTAVHQDNYYFAAGSDSALYIFTLFKDRPPMDLINNQYVCIGYQKQIKLIDLKTSQEKILKNLGDMPVIQDNILQDNIEMVQYNFYDTSKTQIMARLKQNQHNKSKNVSKFLVYEQSTNITQMFFGKAATFIGKSKVVRSKENSDLEIYNYETDQHTLLSFRAEKIFSYAGGKIVIYQDSNLLLVDPLTNKVVAGCPCSSEFSNIKKVIFNSQFIAVQTKRSIYIFTKQLQKISAVTEKVNMKSCIFLSDTQNIVLYTTKVHLKYILMNGDSGILKSTNNILYLIQVQQPVDKGPLFKFIFMDNQWQLQNQTINCEEFLFKQVLFEKNLKNIQAYLATHKSIGDGMVSYLYQKQYSLLAINLVTDKQARFELALSCNNLEIAYRNCVEFKDKKCYRALYEEALRQGNHNVVEACLQQLKDYDKLVFLYAILGQRDKLRTIVKKGAQLKTMDTVFQAALYSGDLTDRSSQLAKLQNLQNLSNYLHGIPNADQSKIHQEDLDWLAGEQVQALVPLQPIIKNPNDPIAASNWPHNFIGESEQLILAGEDDHKVQTKITKSENLSEVLIGNGQPIPQEQQSQPQDDSEEFQDCQWGLDEDDLISQETGSPVKRDGDQKPVLDMKSLKHGYPDYKKQLNPGELCVTEQYEQCVSLLKKQFQMDNIEGLQMRLKQVALSSVMEISMIPYLESAPYLIYEGDERIYLHSHARQELKHAYKLTTEGKFQESLAAFRSIIKQLPLSREKELIPICLNYILAMKCELAKKGVDIARQIELSCYMAMCELQPAHRQLTLRAAMSLAYKHKNYLTAAQIARSLLKLLKGMQNVKPELIENTQKMLRNSEQAASNDFKIRFEESFLSEGIGRLCAQNLVIVNQFERCQFDLAAHSSKQLCAVCELCMVG